MSQLQYNLFINVTVENWLNGAPNPFSLNSDGDVRCFTMLTRHDDRALRLRDHLRPLGWKSSGYTDNTILLKNNVGIIFKSLAKLSNIICNVYFSKFYSAPSPGPELFQLFVNLFKINRAFISYHGNTCTIAVNIYILLLIFHGCFSNLS